MKNINQLLRPGMVIAEIDAHPDDYVPHANAHYLIGQIGGITRHNITLTRGENTGKNYHSSKKFDPKKGHREAEGREGARRMGFNSYEQLAGIDRQLYASESWLVPKVAALLVEREVDLVLTLSQMHPGDSPDHAAASAIALKAAQLAHQATRRSIGVLILQGDKQGDVFAQTTPNSTLLAHQAAEANSSQFRYGPLGDEPMAWPVVSSGQTMHPDDLQALLQYPVQQDATYTFTQIGNVPMPTAAQLAVVSTR